MCSLEVRVLDCLDKDTSSLSCDAELRRSNVYLLRVCQTWRTLLEKMSLLQGRFNIVMLNMRAFSLNIWCYISTSVLVHTHCTVLPVFPRGPLMQLQLLPNKSLVQYSINCFQESNTHWAQNHLHKRTLNAPFEQFHVTLGPYRPLSILHSLSIRCQVMYQLFSVWYSSQVRD